MLFRSSREVRIRVLNCDPRGCLIESSVPMAVGSVATLRMGLKGQTLDDAVQVVRCQAIHGAGMTYHVAMQFLPTTPPYEGTARHGIRRVLAGLSFQIV